jgi:hypothetical protein
MRRRLFVMAAAISGIAAPFVMTAPSHAMTCAADPPVDYGCKVVFYVLGTACGTHPTPPGSPLPPIVSLNTATAINLCPPLG